AYYSRHEPRLCVNGKNLIVAFSDHALLQACHRLSVTWPSYRSLGDVFFFFDQCQEFEPCFLHPNTPAFSFFEHCVPGFRQKRIAKEVLGREFDERTRYSLRVGYCPAVVEGDFFKAKTTLFPGYSGTPEYGKILAAEMPQD